MIVRNIFFSLILTVRCLVLFALTSIPISGQSIWFDADFEGSSLGSATQSNLVSGTATGDWIVSSLEESVVANPASSSTRWLKAELGMYNLRPKFAALELSEGEVVVDFEFAFERLGSGRDHEWSLVQDDNTPAVTLIAAYASRELLYKDSSGTLHSLGANLFPGGGQSAGQGDLKGISISLSAGSWDVRVDGALVGDDLAYRNAITNVDRLLLKGLNIYSGAFYDNIKVSRPSALFDADFEGSSLGSAARSNLLSGTVAGDWIVSSLEESLVANPASSSTRWLQAQSGLYDLRPKFAAANLGQQGVEVDFKFAFSRLGSGRDHEWSLVQDDNTPAVTLIAAHASKELFYKDGSGTLHSLATNLFPGGGQSAGLGDLKEVSILLSANSWSVFVDGAMVGDDLAYRNAITNVDRLLLKGLSQQSGAYYDDIRVAFSEESNLSLHPLFQSHMVLQRDEIVPIWGTALPGAAVSVKLDGAQVGTATADAEGNWLAWLVAHPADGGISHTIVVSSASEPDLQVDDVLFGDVYLASGQSNMWRDMTQGVLNASAEIAAANYPQIRLVEIARERSDFPLEEPVLEESWQQCSPSTVPGFSAAAYFFAREMHQATGVPVGILSSAWGGQRIDLFLNPGGVEAVPELAGMNLYQEQGGITNFYRNYNAMIAPLAPYGVRGIIWYQGESNTGDGDLYRLKMQALIRGWRQDWGQADLPFYYMQISTRDTGNSASWASVRQAQLEALEEPNTGMAVSYDIGDGDVHPYNKQDTGFRLAYWPLALDLNQNIEYSGPLFRDATIETSQIRIAFDYVGGGLMVGAKQGLNPVTEVPGGPLENFEIAGSDKVFTNAAAVIDLNTVVVSSPSVPHPVYVRYCYPNIPAGPNFLYSVSGLPAAPFRTDLTYPLEVALGSGGDSSLIAGTVLSITADAAPSGQVFDRWIGAASEISDPNAATANVTMPDSALYLLATYRPAGDPTYTLTVNGGYGGGDSQSGSILNIEAAAPPAGQVFDRWTGDVGQVVDAFASRTTLRMPGSSVEVTASYKTAP